MEHERERVDGLTADEHVQSHELAFTEAGKVVVEARVAARARLQLVVEVEHDLGQRKLVHESTRSGDGYSMWSKRPRRSLQSSITWPTPPFGTTIEART